MKKIRTAVIGVGSLGRHHLRWLSQISESELVGFYDIDENKREQYAKEYGITSFNSMEEAAAHVDAVSIAVTTLAHFDVASFFIKRGIHCLIEKPICATYNEAIKLKETADDHNVLVTVGQIERFNPAVKALEAYNIQPSFIEAHRLASFDPRGTDVAVVLDLMIHDIDLVLKFVNSQIIDIQASAVAVISDQLDIANARLTFENGAVANLTSSRISLAPMRKLRIFQKSGYFSLDLAKKQADLYSLATADSAAEGMRIPFGKSGQDILYKKVPDDGNDMLATELTAFLRSVINKQPAVVDLVDATEALRIALEVKRIGLESINRVLENSIT